jgi:hypothetical protein
MAFLGGGQPTGPPAKIILLGRRPRVRPAPEEIAQTVPAQLVSVAEPLLRAAELRAGIPPPGPDRGRLGQPDGTDRSQERYHDANQAGGELALDDADPGHGQVEREGGQVQPDGERVAAARGAERRRLHEEHGAERAANQDRVDRLAAALAPVDVVEVEPQGELVQGQRRADPEQRRQHLRPGRLRAVAELEQPGHEHQDDAPYLVMDVHAADVDVGEPAALGSGPRGVLGRLRVDPARDPPGHGEGDQKPDQHPYRGRPAGVDEDPLVPPHAGAVPTRFVALPHSSP